MRINKRPWAYRAISLLLSIMIIMSVCFTSIIATIAAESPESVAANKKTVYLLTDNNSSKIYLYWWKGTDNGWIAGETVNRVTIASNCNLWKFSVTRDFEGALFTTDNKWKDFSDNEDIKLTLKELSLNNVKTDTLYYELIGEQTSEEFLDYEQISISEPETTSFLAEINKQVSLIDLSTVEIKGSLKNFGAAFKLYEDSKLLSSYSNPTTVRYSANTAGTHTLTLNVEDAFGQSYDSSNVTFTVTVKNPMDDFKFDSIKEEYTYSKGLTVDLQKIPNFNDVEYSIDCDETVAKLNSDSKIEIFESGTLTVTASLNGINASYEIVVNKGTRSGTINFTSINPDDLIYVKDLTYVNEANYASAVSENVGKIRYRIVANESDADVASIDATTGKLTVNNAGKVVVEAYITADEYYEEYSSGAKYSIAIIPDDIVDDIKFSRTEPVVVSYGSTEFNELLNVDPDKELDVNYISSDESIVTVAKDKNNANNCVITPKEVSDEEVAITAVLSGRNYKSKKVSFKCKVINGTINIDPNLDGSNIINETYAKDKTVQMNPIVKNGDKKFEEKFTLNYEIICNRDLENNEISEEVVSVNDGIATLKRSGKATLRITATPEYGYNPVSVEIEILVKKGEYTDFKFTKIPNSNLTYNEDHNKNIYAVAAESALSDAPVTYTSSDESIAEITNDNKIAVKKSGTVTITAIKSADDKYNSYEINFDLTIEKADRNWAYSIETQNVILGQTHTILRPEGYEAEVTYSINSENNTANSVLTEDKTGVIPKTIGSTTIHATIAEDECFKSATAEYAINVLQAELPKDFDIYTFISEAPIKENTHSYNTSITITPDNSYKIAMVEKNDSIDVDTIEWTDSITISENINAPSFIFKDRNGEISKIVTTDIMVDVIAPTGRIAFKESCFDKLLSSLTFGLFGNSTTNITVTASDKNPSNVDVNTVSIEYYIASNEDKNKINALGKEELNEINTWEEYDNGIKVNDNIYSVIYVKLTDEFGNASYLSTEGIIYENTRPEVTSEIEAIDSQFGYYYKDITVSDITIIDNKDDAMSSGIKSVDYKVFAESEAEPILICNGNIYTAKTAEMEPQLEDISFTIPVESNYNSVYYTITAVDNCGNNGEYKSNSFRMLSAPEARIKYTDECTDKCSTLIEGTIHNHDVVAEILLPVNDISTASKKDYDASIKAFYDSASIEIDEPWQLKDNKLSKKITFKDGKYQFDGNQLELKGVPAVQDFELSKFIVDTTSPKVVISYDNNAAVKENYYNDTRTAIIKVKDENFIGLNKMFKVTAVDEAKKDIPNIPTVNWKDNKNAQIEFAADANYTFNIVDDTLVDLAGNKAEVTYADGTTNQNEFTVDKTDPSDMKITYKENESIWGTLAELVSNLTNGFVYFGDTITVEVEVKDAISPIDKIIYSAPLAEEHGEGLTGIEETTITNEISYDEEAHSYVASFAVAPEYKGTIQVKAFDKANNSIKSKEDGIVVSNKKPVISVEPKKSANKHDGVSYYKDDIATVITVDDANFDKNNVVITEKTTFDGEEATTRFVPEDLIWENTQGTNEYTTIIKLSGGDLREGYEVLTVEYTNNSHHKADFASVDKMVIDRTSPKVVISYDNNLFKNERYYAKARLATIKVEDNNFAGLQTMVSIEAKDKSGNSISDVPEINWQDNLNAEINYTADADYTFAIDEEKFIDFAGNKAEVVYAEDTTNQNEFTVDKTAPVAVIKYDNNSSKNEQYYDNNRISTVTVTDDNFVGLQDMVKITALDKTGASIEKIPQIMWSSNVQGKIEYLDDANYTFNIDTGMFVDLAGNKVKVVYEDGTTCPNEFTVDKTAPSVIISYDNNNCVNDKYYKEKRIATVTVTDDNFVGLKDMIEVSAVDKTGKSIPNIPEIQWSSNVEGKIEYLADADYTFAIDEEQFVDLADNKAEVIYADGTTNENEFTVDKTSPELLIQYDNNSFKNDKYYAENRTAIITVTDNNFVGLRNMVKISSVDKTGKSLSNVPEIQWISNTYGTIVYSEDGDYIFNIDIDKFVDLAGNKVNVSYAEGTTNENEFIIDKTAPVVSIKYDNNNCKNKFYYDNSRTSTIKVTDNNFVGLQDMVKITACDKTKKPVENAPKIQWTNNVEGKIEYLADADYTFAIDEEQFVDLAGNKAEVIYADGTTNENEFTVDKTSPIVIIGYNNNTYKNGKYYDKGRIATLSVTDDNFNSNTDMVTVTAVNKQKESLSAIPQINWVSNSIGKVEFNEDAIYTFGIDKDKFVDLAGNPVIVEFVNDTTNWDEFVVDKTVPNSAKVTVVDAQNKELGNNLTDKVLSDFEFDKYSNTVAKISLNAKDNLTSISYYYYISSKAMSINDLRNIDDNNWELYGGEFKLYPDRKFIVYAKAVDKAGNTKYFSSDGIILDNKNPDIDGIAPEIKLNPSSNKPKTDLNKDTLYNSDVVIDYTITDPISNNTCSGLNASTLRYEVINNGQVTQQGNLNGKTTNYDGHIQQMVGSITVNSKINNSNNVKLVVYATDNATNSCDESCKLKIDITAPEISVSYDNNSSDSGNYFKDNRTATITIRERNFNGNKVKINLNKDGKNVTPKLSWNHSGNSNLDSYTHIATVSFSDNADYTFSLSYTDEADNKSEIVNYGSSVAPNKFTVDKVKPVVQVAYDNNASHNNNYFDAGRTATVTINEHNFDSTRVVCDIVAVDNNTPVAAPVLSGWNSNGDVHIATVVYGDDAKYTFTINYKDKAGNDSNEIKEEFYVDTTAPKIKITGVNYKSANGGVSNKIGFKIIATDNNFNASAFAREFVKVNINGKQENVLDIGTVTQVANGAEYIVDNIPNDGIYTVKCSVTDMAGNVTSKIEVTDEDDKPLNEENVLFSVNRYGSTFMLDEETAKIVKKGYIRELTSDVKIIEVNPDIVDDYVVSVDNGSNKPRVLSASDNYKRESNISDTSWNTYTYTINKDYFDDEASYTLSLTTKDDAGNKSYSTTNNPQYSNQPLAKVEFVVDRTAPKVVVTNIESNGRYNVDKQEVKIIAKDENILSELKIVLNGKTYKAYDAEALAENKGQISMNIDSSQSLQSLNVIAIDAANNSTDDLDETKIEYNNFLITTNFWIQFINNTPALIITISVILLIIAVIVFLIVRKGKKNEGNNG